MPIKKLAIACDELARGNFDTKVDYSRNDEIGILKNAFNSMAEKLKRHIEDVSRLKELNQKILDGINYGIILFSQNGEILIFNKTAKKLFDKNHQFFYWAKDFIKNYLKKNRLSQKDVAKLPSEDGMSKYVEYEVTPMGENLILCFSDVTEEVKLKEKIEHINRLATIGEMSAALAHEIRNPLQGIKSCFQVIESMSSLAEDHTSKQLFAAIYREIERINWIITSLLHYARPSEPIPNNISLKKIVEEIKPFILPLLKEKALELKCSFPQEDELYLDPNHLKQILMNVITNAVKASKNKGKIEISLRLIGDEAILCIKDEGIGIPEAYISKIFNPFFTTFNDGTGLGLCVVQSLTIKNKGRIWIESTQNRGTTVYLAFPRSFSHHSCENAN
jgi:signal transduction histidine kinase